MKRRDFLKQTVTASAVALASEWYATAWSLRLRPFAITAVVYDERYADCRAFANTLERQGALSFTTARDAASVWYGSLRARVKATGGAVAGMATDADWVVSRTCGREQGLAVAYEASHDCRMSDRLIHRLDGSGTGREVYLALLDEKMPWAEAVASGLIRSSRRKGLRIGSAMPCKADTAETRASTGHPGYLTSWLLVRCCPQFCQERAPV